ncbi:MAG: branched-chain amino acid ABC transporter permease [Polaromonas sp.]|uniref:branched-chain amino acid ABC transporter permease n=1 Tax=Polaromonas sp. TaxID=1869339 RepID=UPI00273122F3|nr:branched-chain amino acid ABC transporter permease [Polaromonas sp.]MDP2451404.1 branched-chain amino acid ABC transporter permease [Polaromonas sp.]MDP3828755.1 branched-chain amino acid ABC transporter permease [Polaromonas sp.]
MDAAFIQFLFAGLTEGARYALVALGFMLVYNASGALNFSQGESVMLGGMTTAVLMQAGIPLLPAMAAAIAVTLAVALLLQKLFSRTLERSGLLEVIIMTVAFGMVVRGVVHVFWGTQTRSVPAFSGNDPLMIGGATILPQVLWVIGITVVVLLILGWFFRYSRAGRGFVAASLDPETAQLMGINVRGVLMLAFAFAAALGAVGGIVTAPITYTYYDVGVMVGLKAVIAAIIGGMGSPLGAVLGGLLIGLGESMTAGYLSSAYKDAVPFLMITLLFLVKPNGLLGKAPIERV